MKSLIEHSCQQVAIAAKHLLENQTQVFMQGVAECISTAYDMQNKVLIAGNGGSLCDAMHFAEELTGFYRKKRKALAAMAISDPGHITCVGNDAGFDSIFSRYIEAHGLEGDVFVALSTSGNSENIVKAMQVAKEKGLKTVAFLGKGGGQIKGQADLEWIVDEFSTSDRIQELHMAAIHIIIEAIEYQLFENTPTLSTMNAH